MGIADRHLRFQRRFLGQREPVIASEWHDRTSKVMRVNQRPAGTEPGGSPFYLARGQGTTSRATHEHGRVVVEIEPLLGEERQGATRLTGSLRPGHMWTGVVT